MKKEQQAGKIEPLTNEQFVSVIRDHEDFIKEEMASYNSRMKAFFKQGVNDHNFTSFEKMTSEFIKRIAHLNAIIYAYHKVRNRIY